MISAFPSIPPGGGADVGQGRVQQLLGVLQPPPQFFSLPRPGTIIPLPLRSNHSPKHLKEATEQVKANFKRSAEYIEKKIALWDLLEDLYYNNRELNQWGLKRSRVQQLNIFKNITQRSLDEDPADWRCHKCISPAPVVDHNVQVLTEAIFGNELYFRVTPDAAYAGGTVEDPEFPTSRKMQAFLLKGLDALHFKTTTNEGIRDGAVFGTMAGKIPWHEDVEYEPALEIDQNYQFRQVEQKNIVRQGPKLDLLNLARFLPDPDAKNSDVQQWEFVGDRGPIPYNLIKARFSTRGHRGPYNVNRKQFLEKWPEGGQDITSDWPIDLKDDPDTQNLSSKGGVTHLQVWEYHGYIYFSDRPHPTECVVTLVTSLGIHDPNEGIVVRFQERAVIKAGFRPYVVWHFIPQAGPLGVGIIEQNLDLIWLLSHAVNLFIDCVRIVSVPMFKYIKNSAWGTKMNAGTVADLIYPGKGIECTVDLNEVDTFSFVTADLRSLIELIRYLENMLEKRTAVSDTTRGLSQNRKTATEVASLMQASQQPLQAALTLIKEDFLDPFGRIALALIQQRLQDDQSVWLKGSAGNVSQTLTLEEIQTGSYRVEATVDMPEHAKLNKAQTINQILATLEQHALPLLLLENKAYKRAGLVEALLRCVGINEETNTIEDVDEQTKQMLLFMMQGGSPQAGPSNQEPASPPGQPNPGATETLPPHLQEMLAQTQWDAQTGSPVPIPLREVA